MKKKVYVKPVVEIAPVKVVTSMLIDSISSVGSNVGLSYGGGGAGDARAKDRGNMYWDE